MECGGVVYALPPAPRLDLCEECYWAWQDEGKAEALKEGKALGGTTIKRNSLLVLYHTGRGWPAMPSVDVFDKKILHRIRQEALAHR
jgi:hypothetical protein